MKIGILGTGIVGRTIAAKFASLNHEIRIGTRDFDATMKKNAQDQYGNPPFSKWLEENKKVILTTFDQAALFGEIVINATSGKNSLKALKSSGKNNLKGKILIDIANPLDTSKGMPPRVAIEDGDSLGEQIQRAFPETKVVKTLNTINAFLMTNPASVASGDHTIFISGNDATAKTQVLDILKSFGWKDIIDLGDITTARATEHYLPLWIRLFGVLQTPSFNLKIIRQSQA